MKIAVAWLMSASVLCFLAACSFEPRYPVAALAYDAKLLGDWELSDDGVASGHAGGDRSPPKKVTVAERLVKINRGRVDGPADPEDKERTRAYLITIAAWERQPEYRLLGHLVKCGDQEVLGVQIDPEQLLKAGPIGMVVPLHLMFLVKRGESSIELHPSDPSVAWVPVVDGWLGSEKKIPEQWSHESIRGHFVLTNSEDDLLAFYSANANDKEFWDKGALLLRRPVAGGGAGR